MCDLDDTTNALAGVSVTHNRILTGTRLSSSPSEINSPPQLLISAKFEVKWYTHEHMNKSTDLGDFSPTYNPIRNGSKEVFNI